MGLILNFSDTKKAFYILDDEETHLVSGTEVLSKFIVLFCFDSSI